MATKNTGPPWMPADDYGRGLKGLGVNLLTAVPGYAMTIRQLARGSFHA